MIEDESSREIMAIRTKYGPHQKSTLCLSILEKMKCDVCGISRVFDQYSGYTYPKESINHGLFFCSIECKENRIRMKVYISHLAYKMEQHRSSYIH